jgi:selT/selW/selH-like putative selenoprotein
VSLAGELLGRWAPIMRTVELRSGNRGRFEVSLDGEVIFSKAATNRFPKRGEVEGLFEERLGAPPPWRKT